jgi:hypothetical protein
MRKIFFISFIVISTWLNAQKQVDVKLNLRDGNTISGTTTMNDVVLKTNYGQLIIPIQNVNSIEVGTGSDKSISEKANTYLKVLNTNVSEDLKKPAYEDLVKLGIKAIAAIIDFQDNPKNVSEIENVSSYSIDNALSELKNNFSLTNTLKVNDVMMIDGEYTMGGLYDFAKMDVKTEYGNLSIPKEKIKTMDISYSLPSNGNEIIIKLLAGKHISGNQNGGWCKTGINLKQGQKFTIMASGEVTLASLSNQKYKPDGSYIAVGGTSYPAIASDYSTATTYPSYGNVVYKISESSYDVLRAGDKFNGTANTSGQLLLSIYETVYNASNTGSYTVKISLK